METKLRLTTNQGLDAFDSKKAAKEVVDIVGFGLGNLIWRIFRGDFKIEGYSAQDIKKYKGTRYFVLGGSIGANGYTKVLLPILAQKQIKKLAKGNAGDIPEILTTNLNSANAGALGTFHAFSADAIEKIRNNAVKVYHNKEIPVLVLIDIGGTKINIVLACVDENGRLNNQILQSHCFPTRRCGSPEEFYLQLVSYMRPVLETFKQGVYKILPQIAIGQPGRILNPKGVIDDGGSDLGTAEGIFYQCNPSATCQRLLNDIGYKMDVYVCNDGIAQFNGLLADIKMHNPELWEKMRGNTDTKIMYLGIGTGIGSGCGVIHPDGSYTIGNFREAYKIKATSLDERIVYRLGNVAKHSKIISLPHQNYYYGDLISSKFFRRYMHVIELDRILNKLPAYFIPYTSLVAVPDNSILSLLKNSDNTNSPLNAIVINKILNDDIISSKAEATVDLNKDEIALNLRKIIATYSQELKGTLAGNIKQSHYSEVVQKIVQVKKTRNTVFFVGIGKSHSIASNLSERYRNLGIHSSCLELTGANSENLTNIKEGDLVFMISNSGKAWELLNLIEYIKKKGCYSVAITGDIDSRLARDCDYVISSLVRDVTNDIVRLPEAPTTTTTAALAAGTAIGVVVCHFFDYSKEQFYLDHPNLIYDHKIKFDGVLADSRFDIEVKVRDIFTQFAKTISSLDKSNFYSEIVSLLKKVLISHYNKRTVFITGAGSSLHVAEKMAATMTSIGIDATAVNPAHLPHGDFAHITPGDLLIIISYSGETNHLRYIYELAYNKGVDVVVITSNRDSTLAREVNPNYVITDSSIGDEKLVPIPNQKIFSSFVDLAVGDAIAVLLAWLIKTTHIQFSTLGHPGGAIARAENTYQKYLKEASAGDIVALRKKEEDNPTRQHFKNILLKHICQINDGAIPQEYSNERVSRLLNQELGRYLDRLKKCKQDIMVFGMGSIGLAYVGRILTLNNRKLVFVESDCGKIANLEKTKRVRLSSGKGKELIVSIKDMIPSSNIEQIAADSLAIDCIFVAIRLNNIKQLVNTILFIVLRRYAYGIQEPINFVFDENFQVYDNSLELLQYEIYRKMDDPNIKSYFDEFVGLVPSINETIVPEVNLEKTNMIKVEGYIAPLYVNEEKWKRKKNENLPHFGKKIIFEKNFIAVHMRKLWMHNLAHSLIGYLGNALGYKTIHEAVSDKKIETRVRDAMHSIGDVLYRRWDYSKTELPDPDSYINWCISKYKNKYIADTVERICRDPERKLRANDRIIGPLNYVWQYDKSVAKDILMGLVAAIRYDPKKYRQLRNEVVQKIKVDPKELNRAMDEFEDFKIKGK